MRGSTNQAIFIPLINGIFQYSVSTVEQVGSRYGADREAAQVDEVGIDSALSWSWSQIPSGRKLHELALGGRCNEAVLGSGALVSGSASGASVGAV